MDPALLFERFQKALVFGMDTHGPEDIVAELRAGTLQVFSNDRAAVFTRVVETPRRKYLHVYLSCGELDGVLSLQPEIDRFSREQGCEYQTATARKGMEKVLPALGWAPKYTTFIRELPHG